MSSLVIVVALLSAANLSTVSTADAVNSNPKAYFDNAKIVERGMGVLPPIKPKNQ